MGREASTHCSVALSTIRLGVGPSTEWYDCNITGRWILATEPSGKPAYGVIPEIQHLLLLTISTLRDEFHLQEVVVKNANTLEGIYFRIRPRKLHHLLTAANRSWLWELRRRWCLGLVPESCGREI